MARRGENIHKRKDGRWEGRYIKGRTGGKPIWGYLYGHSYAEVKAELTRRKALSGFYRLSGASMHYFRIDKIITASSGSISESSTRPFVTFCSNSTACSCTHFSAFFLPIPEEKTYYKGGTAREIETIAAAMNEEGREALLRHARVSCFGAVAFLSHFWLSAGPI